MKTLYKQTNFVPLPDHLRYIVVEGGIGAGKTTLASMLATLYGGSLVLEDFDQSRFLEPFYKDKERWALPLEFEFMESRYRQQIELSLSILTNPKQLAFSDYAFEKDRIFAQLVLNVDELHLFEKYFHHLRSAAPVPDLVVYLRSTPERLLENIAQRDRSYERNVDPGYIADLCRAYDKHLETYVSGPMLTVETAHLDFVRRPQDLRVILLAIASGGYPASRSPSRPLAGLFHNRPEVRS